MENNQPTPRLPLPNNRIAQMPATTHSNIGSQQLQNTNKRMTSVPKIVGSQKSQLMSKRITHVEPMSANFGTPQSLASNKRNMQMEPSPKGHGESSESVRAKLRESLADSLALVSKKQADGNNFQDEAASSLKLADENPCLSNISSTSTDVSLCHIPENSSRDEDSAQKNISGRRSSQEGMANNTTISAPNFKSDGKEYQFNYVLVDEDVPFGDNYFIKDELLQGNGLCWVSDLDVLADQFEESHSAKRLKLLHGEADGVGKPRSPPQDLATRIEAELFKLYGGVNKKYKEKGRSLLFNLKDRNNPELRERVISGEIAPERLCSMTAEELASKELSEWRIAKAEELAQMVVLPDSSADVRRLVKKTHKGEFQVEFEQDDGVSMEVAMGASSLSQIRQKTGEKEFIENATIEASKHDTISSEDLNIQSSLTTLPDDSTDLMQGLMGEELKDADLPPIVSLDEFMESLDSEPPFENLPIDSGMVNQKSDEKGTPDVDVKLESSDHGSVNVSDTNPDKLEKEVEYARMDHNLKPNHIDGEPVSATSSSPIRDLKLNHSPKESGKTIIDDTSMQEHVWEGLLQLNVSSMVTVIGNFKSGERTSATEWTSFLDVKGRVKLDAFEKFLQELPMSRSRTIMTVHFCWKEGSPESGRVNLCEVIDSYVADERVGFAEPAPGVELYLCPPHGKISEILGKHLTKDHIDTLNAINDGLIGIVVWRKAHLTSTISPNSSSHHKHNARMHHLSSVRRQQEQNSNANISRGPPLPREPPPSNPDPLLDELTDDIPPGFGPSAVAAKDEDDLPEFDFSRGSNSSAPHLSAATTNPSSNKPLAQTPVRPSRAVEQMRELIHKYGRGEMTSRGSEVVDDDDDIPEWQPQFLSQPLAPPQRQLAPSPHTPPSPMVAQLVQSFQQPGLATQMISQPQHFQLVQQFTTQYHNQQLEHTHPMPMQPMNINVQQNLNNLWQQGTCWPLPPPPPPPPPPQLGGPPVQNSVLLPNFGEQPLDGQYYGTPPGFAAGQNGVEWSGGWM